MLAASVFLLAGAEGALAKSGGNSNDHGGMRSFDSGRNHDKMKSRETDRHRDRRNRVTQHDDKEKGGDKHAEKKKDKAPGTTTAANKPPAAGRAINDTIHPVPGTPTPVAVSGTNNNTIHPIIANGAAGVVTVSNGVTKQQIPNGPGGVTVYSSSPGMITVTNGKDSVTLNGGSLTLSGNVLGVGAGQNIQVGPRNGEGNTVVAISPPSAVPLPNGGKVDMTQGGGFGVDVLKGVTDFGYGLEHGFSGGPAPPPSTSTTTQQVFAASVLERMWLRIAGEIANLT
jgi:hypothetical protein